MNRVSITGTIAENPSIKPGSTYKLAEIRVETKRKVKEGRGQDAVWKDEIETIPVTVWGEQADFVCKHFRQGSGIIIEGRIKSRQNGNYLNISITAETIEFPPGGGGGGRATTPAAMDEVRQGAGLAPRAAVTRPSPAAAEGDDSIPF